MVVQETKLKTFHYLIFPVPAAEHHVIFGGSQPLRHHGVRKTMPEYFIEMLPGNITISYAYTPVPKGVFKIFQVNNKSGFKVSSEIANSLRR